MSLLRVKSRLGIWGEGVALLVDGRGLVVQRVPFRNLVTELGDRLYGERGADLPTKPPAPTGMHLGSGTTYAASKSGNGAAIQTYIAGSNVGFNLGFPTSAKPSSARQMRYKVTWAPGVAQVANINEAAVVNQAIATNAGAPAASTVSRVKFATTIDKSAADLQLILIWDHNLLGA